MLAALSATGAAVSLAAFPAEPGLSEIVRELNRRGVPIDLWLNLPYELGYWQSKGNIEDALRESERLMDWIERDQLKVRNVGIDVEPTLQLTALLLDLRVRELVAEIRAMPRPRGAQRLFERMIRGINATHGVDIYVHPLFGHRLGRVIFNLYCIPEDFREDPRNQVVSMLYSSLVPVGRARFVERFIGSGEIPAVGVVSANRQNPGVDLRGRLAARLPQLLIQDSLNMDVKQVRKIYRARRLPPSMYVFALNGHGTLEQVTRAAGA